MEVYFNYQIFIIGYHMMVDVRDEICPKRLTKEN